MENYTLYVSVSRLYWDNWLNYTLIGDYFLPAYQCPHRVKRVGTMGDGGKYVCGLERVAAKKKPCVIYSVGELHSTHVLWCSSSIFVAFRYQRGIFI